MKSHIAIQQIDFTGNLPRERNRDATLNFIIEEAKETKLNCSNDTVNVLRMFSYNLVRVAKVFDLKTCSIPYFD